MISIAKILGSFPDTLGSFAEIQSSFMDTQGSFPEIYSPLAGERPASWAPLPTHWTCLTQIERERESEGENERDGKGARERTAESTKGGADRKGERGRREGVRVDLKGLQEKKHMCVV